MNGTRKMSKKRFLVWGCNQLPEQISIVYKKIWSKFERALSLTNILAKVFKDISVVEKWNDGHIDVPDRLTCDVAKKNTYSKDQKATKNIWKRRKNSVVYDTIQNIKPIKCIRKKKLG